MKPSVEGGFERKPISARKLKWMVLLIATLYTRFHPVLFALNLGVSLVLAIVAFAGLCRSVFRGRIDRAQLAAIAVPIAWYGFLVLNLHYSWVERVEIELHMNKFASCAARGVEVVNGQRLSICEIDNRWWRYCFTKAIVYDASRQVELSRVHRTPAWERAAHQMKGVPFGVVGFSVSHLRGSYYALFFEDDKLPDF